MLSDFRFALRSMRLRLGFSIAACGTLALGMTAVTTMFTFVNSIVLAPLPFPDPDALVQFCDTFKRQDKDSALVSIPDVTAWQEESAQFSDIGYFASATMALTGQGEAEPIQIIRVSEGVLSALRIQPTLGRWFVKEEYADGPDRSCMITHSLWKRKFAQDPAIVGKPLALNGNAVTIVGVMPPGFRFPDPGEVALTSGFINWEKKHRDARWFKALGRLKSGVSIQSAQAGLDGISLRLQERFRKTNADHGVKLVPLKQHVLGETAGALRVLFASVCCVLIIACANVASLLVVRAIERKKEYAIRIALGASRLRIATQQLTESILLSCISGTVAILASFWTVKAMVALSPAQLPRLSEVHIDISALIFCLVVSAACGIGFGLAPLFHTFREALITNLNEEGRSGSASRQTVWIRNGILLSQVAITVLLITCAGLLIRSYFLMQAVDIGFKPDGVVVSKIALRRGQYPSEWERNRLFKPLLSRLEQSPGTRSVSLAMWPPFTSELSARFVPEESSLDPSERLVARLNSVSDGYFATVGMALISGRNFAPEDNKGDPRSGVVIVNQALAKKYWLTQNPVGKRIFLDTRGTNAFTIVGVVSDIHQSSVTDKPEPELYFPFSKVNEITVHVVAKLESYKDASQFHSRLKKELAAVDNNQAAGPVEFLDAIVATSLEAQRFRMYLLSAFAVIALILSAVGIFGFLSYVVQQRTREIGILAALGATPRSVIATLMKDTMGFLGLGIAAGIVGALGASRLIESLLFGVRSGDIVTFVLSALFVGIVGTLSIYFPVRKAAQLEVMTALRA